MDVFTLKLLIIFFPGIVGVIVINYAIKSDKKLEVAEGIAYSFVLGLLSYLYAYIFKINDVFSQINSEKFEISGIDILATLGLSIGFSILIIIVIKKEYFHYVLRKLKISTSTGNKYILKNIISTKDSNLNYLQSHQVCIRYQNKKLNYIGYIQTVDILNDSYIEMLLKNVTVSTEDGNYELEALYLCEKPENFVIEYIKIEDTEN